jgi:serine/threonine-protein kinase
MGVVYLARHVSLKEDVALKVLYPHLTGEGEFATRFQREGAAMAKLRHPNIAQVLNADVVMGYHFLAMEYASDGTLRQVLDRRRQLPVDEALAIIRQMALALQHAHANGVIHRDIKPSNMLNAGSGRYLLTDFGVAQVATEPKITKNLATMGTPEYMSPEQGQGLTLDGRSDVYSLGVVLYEMLAGRPPFSSETHLATLFQHAKESVPPIQKFRPDAPAPIRAIVHKALAKNPKDRFQSAAEMVAAIDAAAQGKRTAPAKPKAFMIALGGVAVVSLGLAAVLIIRGLTTATSTAAPSITVVPPTTAVARAQVAEATATLAPVPTEAADVLPTATETPAPTSASTSTSIPTSTATETPTQVPTDTPTPTLAPTETATPEPTATNTSEPTQTPSPTARPSNTPRPTSATAPGVTATPAARAPASVTLSLVGAGAERRNRPPQWDQGDPAICSYLDTPGDPNRELIWRLSVSVKLKNTSNTQVNLAPGIWTLKAQSGYVMRACLPNVRIPARGEASVAIVTFFEKDKLVPYRLELAGTRQAVCFVPVGNYSDLSQASLSFAAQKCR